MIYPRRGKVELKGQAIPNKTDNFRKSLSSSTSTQRDQTNPTIRNANEAISIISKEWGLSKSLRGTALTSPQRRKDIVKNSRGHGDEESHSLRVSNSPHKEEKKILVPADLPPTFMSPSTWVSSERSTTSTNSITQFSSDQMALLAHLRLQESALSNQMDQVQNMLHHLDDVFVERKASPTYKHEITNANSHSNTRSNTHGNNNESKYNDSNDHNDKEFQHRSTLITNFERENKIMESAPRILKFYNSQNRILGSLTGGSSESIPESLSINNNNNNNSNNFSKNSNVGNNNKNLFGSSSSSSSSSESKFYNSESKLKQARGTRSTHDSLATTATATATAATSSLGAASGKSTSVGRPLSPSRSSSSAVTPASQANTQNKNTFSSVNSGLHTDSLNNIRSKTIKQSQLQSQSQSQSIAQIRMESKDRANEMVTHQESALLLTRRTRLKLLNAHVSANVFDNDADAEDKRVSDKYILFKFGWLFIRRMYIASRIKMEMRALYERAWHLRIRKSFRLLKANVRRKENVFGIVSIRKMRKRIHRVARNKEASTVQCVRGFKSYVRFLTRLGFKALHENTIFHPGKMVALAENEWRRRSIQKCLTKMMNGARARDVMYNQYQSATRFMSKLKLRVYMMKLLKWISNIKTRRQSRTKSHKEYINQQYRNVIKKIRQRINKKKEFQILIKKLNNNFYNPFTLARAMYVMRQMAKRRRHARHLWNGKYQKLTVNFKERLAFWKLLNTLKRHRRARVLYPRVRKIVASSKVMTKLFRLQQQLNLKRRHFKVALRLMNRKAWRLYVKRQTNRLKLSRLLTEATSNAILHYNKNLYQKKGWNSYRKYISMKKLKRKMSKQAIVFRRKSLRRIIFNVLLANLKLEHEKGHVHWKGTIMRAYFQWWDKKHVFYYLPVKIGKRGRLKHALRHCLERCDHMRVLRRQVSVLMEKAKEFNNKNASKRRVFNILYGIVHGDDQSVGRRQHLKKKRRLQRIVAHSKLNINRRFLDRLMDFAANHRDVCNFSDDVCKHMELYNLSRAVQQLLHFNELDRIDQENMNIARERFFVVMTKRFYDGLHNLLCFNSKFRDAANHFDKSTSLTCITLWKKIIYLNSTMSTKKRELAVDVAVGASAGATKSAIRRSSMSASTSTKIVSSVRDAVIRLRHLDKIDRLTQQPQRGRSNSFGLRSNFSSNSLLRLSTLQTNSSSEFYDDRSVRSDARSVRSDGKSVKGASGISSSSSVSSKRLSSLRNRQNNDNHNNNRIFSGARAILAITAGDLGLRGDFKASKQKAIMFIAEEHREWMSLGKSLAALNSFLQASIERRQYMRKIVLISAKNAIARMSEYVKSRMREEERETSLHRKFRLYYLRIGMRKLRKHKKLCKKFRVIIRKRLSKYYISWVSKEQLRYRLREIIGWILHGKKEDMLTWAISGWKRFTKSERRVDEFCHKIVSSKLQNSFNFLCKFTDTRLRRKRALGRLLMEKDFDRMHGFFPAILSHIHARHVDDDKLAAAHAYYIDYTRRLVLNNLLQFRRNHAALEHYERKHLKYFMRQLLVLKHRTIFQKALGGIADRVLLRKHFQRLRGYVKDMGELKLQRAREGMKSGRGGVGGGGKRIVRCILYADVVDVIHDVSVWRRAFLLRRAISDWIDQHKLRPRVRKFYRYCDWHCINYHRRLVIKRLLRNLGSKRRNRRMIETMNRYNAIRSKRAALNSLDMQVYSTWRGEQEYGKILKHVLKTKLLKGFKALENSWMTTITR